MRESKVKAINLGQMLTKIRDADISISVNIGMNQPLEGYLIEVGQDYIALEEEEGVSNFLIPFSAILDVKVTKLPGYRSRFEQ